MKEKSLGEYFIDGWSDVQIRDIHTLDPRDAELSRRGRELMDEGKAAKYAGERKLAKIMGHKAARYFSRCRE